MQQENAIPSLVERVRSILACLIVALGTAACMSSSQSQTNTSSNGGGITLPANSPLSTPLLCPQNQGNNSPNAFVAKNGTSFIYQGKPLKLYGYTFYRGSSHWQKPQFTDEINAALTMGQIAGQNLIRPTDFWDQRTAHQNIADATIWHNMDYLVCTARQQRMFVVMDISAFRWLLMSKGRDPYDASNWKAFLNAVGTHYSNQPSIAFYSISGEPHPPKTVDETQHLVDFYRAVTDELSHADQKRHLITAGGFNHMGDETPQTPWWHETYALPNNDIIAFKTYSQNDLKLIPTITAYAQQLNKPMVDEEFGLPQRMGDAASTGQAYNGIFSSRAQFFETVYSSGEQGGVAGFVFWDMGCELAAGSYQISPKTPAVWHVIQAHAPTKRGISTIGESIC